jgi:hypothetical protein
VIVSDYTASSTKEGQKGNTEKVERGRKKRMALPEANACVVMLKTTEEHT